MKKIIFDKKIYTDENNFFPKVFVEIKERAFLWL